MTAVLAVLLVVGAVILCAAAWHTRGHGAVPFQELAPPADDDTWAQELLIEVKATKNTPPWPPLPHPDAAAGSQGGGHDWLAAPTLPSQEPVAPWRGRRADHQEADGNLAGDPPMPAPSHPETWTDYHGPWTTRKVRADEARDWRPVLPPMSAQLAQGIRDAEDAQRWPELQHGYGYADGTGTFTRIVEDGEVA